MNRHEILELIRGLAGSTGLYSRLYFDLMDLPADVLDETLAKWEKMNFKTELDFIRYYEEGVLPEGYEPEELTDTEIKVAVADQLAGMIKNNIVNGYGVESFRGWLEDGEVFRNIDFCEGDVEKAMKLADQLAEAVDTINQVLGESPYDD